MRKFARILVIIVIIVVVLFNAVIISGSTIINLYNKKVIGVSVVPEKSGFFHFFHAGENTYYKCKVTLKNETSESKRIILHGLLPVDYLLGYIGDPVIKAIQEGGKEPTFVLYPNSENMYYIYFQANRGRIDNKKFNRCLPWIVCIEND